MRMTQNLKTTSKVRMSKIKNSPEYEDDRKYGETLNSIDGSKIKRNEKTTKKGGQPKKKEDDLTLKQPQK